MDLPPGSALPARPARLLVAALVAAGAVRAAAAPDVRISWDEDLAFEWDRANYERTLAQLVRASEAEVSSWLSWRRARPLEVRVITRAQYEAEFGSDMGWNSGAHYRDGVINVNGGAQLDGWFAGMLAHEMTHAFVEDGGTGCRLPMWLNEGLATRLGYRARGQHDLTTSQVQELEVALEQRRLLPLPTGGAMNHFRYLQSFAAVLFLEKKLGKEALLALVRRAMAKGTFEQALDAELRWTMKNVEEGFAYWVDHLQ
jgi:hypothetical protein